MSYSHKKLYFNRNIEPGNAIRAHVHKITLVQCQYCRPAALLSPVSTFSWLFEKLLYILTCNYSYCIVLFYFIFEFYKKEK